MIPAENFSERFRWSEQDEVTGTIQENLDALLEEVGIDVYELPAFADLPEEVREAIEKANVWTLLKDQLNKDNPNMRTVRFALQQIRWWGLADEEGLILGRMRRLDTVFSDAIGAATASPDLTMDEKREIAERLLDLVDDDVFGHLEYSERGSCGSLPTARSGTTARSCRTSTSATRRASPAVRPSSPWASPASTTGSARSASDCR